MKEVKEVDKYNWNSISGDKYWEIVDILNNPDASEMQKQAELIALIEDVDIDTILNMNMNDVAVKINKLEFLNKFEIDKHYKPRKIKVGDIEYNVYPDLTNLNVAQFMDYQTFITKPFRESYDKILSIFIIPAGHNYNEGYDILDVQKMIRENMSWVNIQSLLNFIVVKYVKSYMRIQAYLTKKVRKEKNPQKKMEMERNLNQLMKSLKILTSFRFSA